ncbi:glycosyl-4,4'-diaponeurosporenoate acyltransferase CrtO family protein [Brumimicrobium aurantiacum]|uniref:Glycosyl-4,4'-diaponeurosporenoate acyltransferase n=1 Tax=Brumimicrobium aurantiacum TaxID=1737063 RepID=A0A3E1F1D4_9FLAO|nr:hypothetical protein [Brumimicrobium aurantiacum]RFC55537.1 hypothetical protein DXU93_00975 [Brumimicrobium aurantiacum]
MVHYLTFGISISFISWIVGIIGNSVLEKTDYYQTLSHMNFIPNRSFNKWIGLKYFKWIVRNTFFKFFNPDLKLKGKKVELSTIRYEMTKAEIGHLIGFVFVVGFAIYKGINENWLFAFIIIIPNVLMNLYPSLLQQENKRRIDLLLKRKSIKVQ